MMCVTGWLNLTFFFPITPCKFWDNWRRPPYKESDRLFYQQKFYKMQLTWNDIKVALCKTWSHYFLEKDNKYVHQTKLSTYGYLPPISQTIQLRIARHVGYSWRNKWCFLWDSFIWTHKILATQKNLQSSAMWGHWVWFHCLMAYQPSWII